MRPNSLVLPLGICAMLLGCGPAVRLVSPTTPGSAAPILVTRAEQLNDAVGQLVTLQGEVVNSNIPTILGVDVESFDPDLRGQRATATGHAPPVKYNRCREALSEGVQAGAQPERMTMHDAQGATL